MRLLKTLFVLAIALVLFLAPSQQLAAAQTTGIDLFVDRVDSDAFPVIQVQLSAWDASGLPLTGLTPDDFTLQEDSGVKFNPESVQAQTEADLRVILAIDISGSMQGKPLEDAKIAAARFLENLEKGDQAGLVAFSNDVNPDPAVLIERRERNLTANLLPLYDTIDALKAEGGTELYNAAVKSVKLLEGSPSGHRAVLLLSDGQNEPADVGDPEEAIRLAKEARVPFFIIGLGNTIDEPYLRRLATETGGLYRPAPSSSDLAALFGDMGELLKTRYIVRYTSTLPTDGRSATLSIELNTHGESAKTAVMVQAPLIPATATPEPTAVPPTKAPLTQIPTAAPVVVVPPVEPPAPGIPWGWIAAGGALVLGGGIFALTRKAKPKPEACAKCGYNLTGKSGPCPECGEIRRLPRT